jgi:hypothetical protein
MKRLIGTLEQLTDQRDALDKLEGLPRKAENIGSAIAHLVPDVYFEGALGWTGHVAEVGQEYDIDTGEAVGEPWLTVDDELAERHQGASATLDDGRVVVVDFSNAEDA